MTYRNGTYIAFHGGGTTNPTASDIKYYNILKGWYKNKNIEFYFINSHEKTNSVRDSSKKETLKKSLIARLRKSKNMLLVITETTQEDTDWVPFEIKYAIDTCEIPIIACYPKYTRILKPKKLESLWPKALKTRINNDQAQIIHIPFKKRPIQAAIKQFSHNNPPSTPLSYYNPDAYKQWELEENLAKSQHF